MEKIFKRRYDTQFRVRSGSFSLFIVMLFLFGCAGVEKTTRKAASPAPISQLADQAGFRVFDFPRDVFKPGTIVQIDAGGRIVRTPAGSLQECQASGGGKEAPLKVTRGEGPSGNSEALVRQGAQISLQTLEKILPIRFGRDAQQADHVVMKVPHTTSEYLGSIQIEDWLSSRWSRLSDACRDALADPDKAILDEVLSADKGFELSFLSADLKTMSLSATSLPDLIATGAESVGARIESNRLTFQTPLPFWYTLYRSCRSFDAARLGEEGYRRCVRKLSSSFQTPVLAEAVRQLKARYASALEAVPSRDPAPEEFKTLNGLIDFLLAIEPRDGHGLYYRGEAQRLLHRKDKNGAGYLGSHDAFYKYLNQAEILKGENGSRPIGCGDDALGYCPERTAWIANLLAQDFYRTAQAKEEEKRKGDLCKAAEYAEFALKLRNEKEFRDPIQGTPTEDLIEAARGQLVRLRLGPCR